jgi:5-methylcytosine-specific restriction protein A
VDFERNRGYRRREIRLLAGLPADSKGGNWDTGIVEHGNEFLIFANIGTEGRTGHDYKNHWAGNRLHWYHKNRSRLAWMSVRRLLKPGRRIHVFWRSSNESPFQYAGLATPAETIDSTPVEIVLEFI